MKAINDDTEGFFDTGGWSFLDPESEVRTVTCIMPNNYNSFHRLGRQWNHIRRTNL